MVKFSNITPTNAKPVASPPPNLFIPLLPHSPDGGEVLVVDADVELDLDVVLGAVGAPPHLLPAAASARPLPGAEAPVRLAPPQPGKQPRVVLQLRVKGKRVWSDTGREKNETETF